jgi:hypothetical protein
MAKKKVLIIGAGMAGLISGIQLAKTGNKVTIFERNPRIGKKLLVTGNGRCNLANKNMSSDHYHSESLNLYETIYNQFDLDDTKKLFSEFGIDLIELDEGKLYPMSLQAKSVVLSLLLECERLGVDIVYDTRVQSVEHKDKFKITTEEKVYYGTQLVIATGGKSYSDSGSSGDGYIIAKNFGHSIIDLHQSIVQLKTDGLYNKSLKGVKAHVEGKLLNNSNNKEIIRVENGEVLFTEYGLSGPVILQLSTKVEPLLSQGAKLSISLDFMPNMTVDELDQYLMERLHKLSYRSVQDALNGFVNQRFMVPFLKRSNIKLDQKAGDINKIERQALVNTMKAFEDNITDTYLWNQAQVTKGGVSCLEVNADSLESNIIPNLFFAGEILDIDGDCGGYNLQWAISSGAAVAKHIHNK